MCKSVILFLFFQVFSLENPSICTQKKEFEPLVQSYEFYLPDLPYSHNFLEPVLQYSIVYTHHDQLNTDDVNQLNLYVGYHHSMQGQSVVQLLERASSKINLQRYAGGMYNHLMYWWVLTNEMCSQSSPTGKLLEDIEKFFGSVDQFKKDFEEACKDSFGSGWVWTCVNLEGEIEIWETDDQENPLMEIDGKPKCYPFFGIDLWEHAYYLQYQWERDEYIEYFWGIVDWKVVALFYEEYASRFIALPLS